MNGISCGDLLEMNQQKGKEKTLLKMIWLNSEKKETRISEIESFHIVRSPAVVFPASPVRISCVYIFTSLFLYHLIQHKSNNAKPISIKLCARQFPIQPIPIAACPLNPPQHSTIQSVGNHS